MTDMQLDDRKIKIMQAIIRNYLETGEPVGSIRQLLEVRCGRYAGYA